MIHEFCRAYRLSLGFSLVEITTPENYHTVYSFERGKSSNINHVKIYHSLAMVNNDVKNFEKKLLEAMRNQFYG